MFTNISRVARVVAVTAGLFSGVLALTYNPTPANAQDEVRCFVCACDSAQCVCMEVACSS
jgi:hypothetical protein